VRWGLAEQSRKIYISAREFIDSWEKEIYELTNLDYFIFSLINELALELEKNFFTRFSSTDALYLHSEEIGILSFNMGDSTQSFLDKNCFSSCNMNCPLQLNEDVSSTESMLRQGMIALNSQEGSRCHTKEECLYADLLNYVVLDSLLDFYNYEMGLVMEDGNMVLTRMAEFIMDIIISFTKNKGQKWLQNRDENASDLFERHIQSEQLDWQNDANLLDDDLEGDEWKLEQSKPVYVIESFLSSLSHRNDLGEAPRIIDRFNEFITDFLELERIEELAYDDIEEFLTIVVNHEFLMDEQINLDLVADLFESFIDYLEYNYNLNFKEAFKRFRQTVFPHILRTFRLIRRYNQRHPYVDYLLSASHLDEDEITEGFFKVHRQQKAKFVLQDIHLSTEYAGVHVDESIAWELQTGDILHGQLKKRNKGWEFVHLEMIYPENARPYLF